MRLADIDESLALLAEGLTRLGCERAGPVRGSGLTPGIAWSGDERDF